MTRHLAAFEHQATCTNQNHQHRTPNTETEEHNDHEGPTGGVHQFSRNMTMNDQYDSSFDVGVAVEEEELKPTVLPTSKAKRRRLPSTTATDVVVDTAVQDDQAVAGDGDVAVATPSTSLSASVTKKRTKKKRRKEKGDEVVGGVTNASEKSSVDAPPQPPLKGMFIEDRRNLPVYRHRAEICNLVFNNDVVLVVAETVSLQLIPYIA